MADVAAMAGVSSQTVSRVANHLPNVEDDTRQRVLSAMRLLGYRPNTAARALATGSFGVLGVISFSLTAYGNARTLGAISSAAQLHGYTVNVITAKAPTEQAVHEAFDRLALQAVDGIVIIEAQILDSPSLRLPDGVPVVIADGAANQRIPTVDIDQSYGAQAATQHLLDLGHRTVWHIAGPQDSYAAQRRAESWHATLKASGRPVPPVVFGDWSAQSGFAAGRQLAQRNDVTAVFAANDQMALGVILALHQAGRSVPGDVSVVGFDDMEEARFFLPPLTTIRQDFEEVGQRCVSLLLEHINSGHVPVGAAYSISPTLVTRESTRAT
jgi:DNA-binding LacI/PurR family transcriptional regulator